MTKEHRYTLERGSKKHLCPECGKMRFVRYIDTEIGEHLPRTYGRCDREINCGYHLNPYTDGYAKMMAEKEKGNYSGNWKPTKQEPRLGPTAKPVSIIPVVVFRQSRKGYHQNNFVQWLTTLFDSETTSELISRYHIGTSKHWDGATVFWQIDTQGKVRSGKIMLYSPTTGKRVKEPFNHITWMHKTLKLPDFNLQQCLFGEHLLKDSSNPIAIVESEKTAIVASVYLSQFFWLAVGSLSNLNFQKCRVLAGKDVYLFPDLNAYEKWKEKAKELSQQIPGIRLEVSNLLERKASKTERTKGLDLADYLTQFEWEIFREKQNLVQEINLEEQPELILTRVGQSRSESQNLLDENLTKLNISNRGNLTKPHFPNHINLSKPDIQTHIYELETYFARIRLPTQPVKLNQFTTITNVSKFINSHLNTLKANRNKETFLPYLNRLQELKQAVNDKYQMI